MQNLRMTYGIITLERNLIEIHGLTFFAHDLINNNQDSEVIFIFR